MTQEEAILTKSQELFFRLGVRSVSMDDLARELGMSKKTLYKYVSNKADLVKKVMEAHFETEKLAVCEIEAKNLNAIEEMIATVKRVLQHLSQIHPSSIYDIQKYYPRSWALFREYKNTFIFECVQKNIDKGIAEGLYRVDIHPNIIARLYVGNVDFIINPSNFSPNNYVFSDLYKEFIIYHLRGVASEKGVAYLKKHTIELF